MCHDTPFEKRWVKAGVGKVRPAGQILPAEAHIRPAK